MGADISQFKQADLVKHIPDLAKIDEFGNGEGGGKKFQVSKSQSPSFAHFSDYSMFPDRFNGKSSPRAILGKVIKIPSRQKSRLLQKPQISTIQALNF